MRWLSGRRTRSLEAEIDLEFDFHVQRCADALIADGMSPDAAAEEARRRFGNRAEHLQACRRHAPEDSMQTMIRWCTGLTMIALVAAVAVLGLTVTRQASLLRDLESRLPSRSTDPSVPPIATAAEEPRHPVADTDALSDFPEPRMVRVGGAVARPGAYALPEHATLTASRLVIAAGGGQQWARIHVLPGSDAESRLEYWRSAGHPVATVDGLPSMMFRHHHHESMGPPPQDLFLEPGDVVWVEKVPVPTTGD